MMNPSKDESPQSPTNSQKIEENLSEESTEEEVSEYDPEEDLEKERKAKRIKTVTKRLPLSKFYEQETLPTKSLLPTCLDLNENARRWALLIEILQRWNTELGIPSVTEIGESSTHRKDFLKSQEPADYPVPLLIASLAKAEDRIYQLEKALIELPKQETVKQLLDRIEDLEASNFDKTLKILELESKIELMTKITESTQTTTEVISGKTAELERKIDALTEQMTRWQNLSIPQTSRTR